MTLDLSISERTKRGISKSARLAALFSAGCERRLIALPSLEFKFAYDRRWRFDLAWEFHQVALEIDGGAFVGGRHGRGAGLRKEHEKMNRAAVDGWRILRCFPEAVLTEETYAMVRKALEHGGSQK